MHNTPRGLRLGFRTGAHRPSRGELNIAYNKMSNISIKQDWIVGVKNKKLFHKTWEPKTTTVATLGIIFI